MSFIRSNFINGRNPLNTTSLEVLASAPFTGDNIAPVLHSYGSSTDSIATISASGYFNELATTDATPTDFSLPLVRIGDQVNVLASNGIVTLEFTSVTVPYTVTVASGALPANSVGTTQLQDGAVTLSKLATALQPSNVIIAAGFFNGPASDTVTITGVTGITGDDFAFVSIFSSTNAVSVQKVTPGVDEIDVLLSGDPGAGTVLTYMVVGG